MLRLLPSPINPLTPSQKEETLPGQASGSCAKKALVWVWFYAVFLEWEKLNGFFLPPFLGNRPVASRSFSELDVPMSLVSGPQTWITAL